MGDKFERIKHATIINRSAVVSAFNTLKDEHDTETADALMQIAEAVAESSNQAAAVLFDQFSEELQKQDRNKTALRQFWDGLVSVLPSIATLTDAVAKIVRVFGGS